MSRQERDCWQPCLCIRVECKWCNSCLACHFQHQYLLLAYNSLATKTVVRHAPHPATRHHPSPLPSALPSPCIFNESDALEKVLKQGFLLWGLVCVFLVHFEKARGYNILKPPQAHLQRQNTARISCHRSFKPIYPSLHTKLVALSHMITAHCPHNHHFHHSPVIIPG